MRLAALSALVLALSFTQPALAQTPGAPTKPIAPTKPEVTKPATPKPAVTATPASGQMELLCRDPGKPPGGVTLTQGSVLNYERVSLRDAAGALQVVYLPTHVIITLGFTPATAMVSGRGEALAQGSCGLRASVISPVAGYPYLRLAISSPPAFSLGTSDNQATVGHYSSSGATPILPPCASGVRSFTVNRTSATEFYVDMYSPGKTACVE